MRLAGTRYQEHGWEQVRKLLGQCSLLVFRQAGMGQLMPRLLDAVQSEALLEWYTGALAANLRAGARSARAETAANSYGESVAELALSLAYELPAQPAFWQAFVAALAGEQRRSGAFWEAAGADAVLRKKVNDMYAGLRDKVDADNYQVATGRACSPNKIYTYRMLDTCYHDLAALFANWQQHAEQVAAILGREAAGLPIEVRQMKSIAGCKAEWIIRWSETQERFGATPGPLHTKSKRFSSLKNSPEKIAAMLAEIGDYEELSSNQDRADDWLGDAGEAATWMDDYWRVVNQSLEADASGAEDQLLPAPEDEFAAGEDDAADSADSDAEPDTTPAPSAQQIAQHEALAGSVSLPPRYMQLASAAQDQSSPMLQLLSDASLAIRLAVYQKLLGSADDSYPDAWRDPATGELPTLQQLAGLEQVSMPTLRKRRDAAIASLLAAGGNATMKE